MTPETIRARQDELSGHLADLLDTYADVLNPTALMDLDEEDDPLLIADAARARSIVGWALALEWAPDDDPQRSSFVGRFAAPFQSAAHTLGILHMAVDA